MRWPQNTIAFCAGTGGATSTTGSSSPCKASLPCSSARSFAPSIAPARGISAANSMRWPGCSRNWAVTLRSWWTKLHFWSRTTGKEAWASFSGSPVRHESTSCGRLRRLPAFPRSCSPSATRSTVFISIIGHTWRRCLRKCRLIFLPLFLACLHTPLSRSLSSGWGFSRKDGPPCRSKIVFAA